MRARLMVGLVLALAAGTLGALVWKSEMGRRNAEEQARQARHEAFRQLPRQHGVDLGQLRIAQGRVVLDQIDVGVEGADRMAEIALGHRRGDEQCFHAATVTHHENVLAAQYPRASSVFTDVCTPPRRSAAP